MPVSNFKTWTPSVGKNVFIAPTAWLTGKVTVGDNVSIFFGATLRGDIESVFVGSNTNIQEGALLHTSSGLGDCRVGNGVTIGHGSIVHGCTVEDSCIIGMGSVILDGAVVGTQSIVGAQALVPLNMKIPPRSLVLGVPAKVVRTLSDDEVRGIEESARHYVELGHEYIKQLG